MNGKMLVIQVSNDFKMNFKPSHRHANALHWNTFSFFCKLQKKKALIFNIVLHVTLYELSFVLKLEENPTVNSNPNHPRVVGGSTLKQEHNSSISLALILIILRWWKKLIFVMMVKMVMVLFCLDDALHSNETSWFREQKRLVVIINYSFFLQSNLHFFRTVQWNIETLRFFKYIFRGVNKPAQNLRHANEICITVTYLLHECYLTIKYFRLAFIALLL